MPVDDKSARGDHHHVWLARSIALKRRGGGGGEGGGWNEGKVETLFSFPSKKYVAKMTQLGDIWKGRGGDECSFFLHVVRSLGCACATKGDGWVSRWM